MTFGTFLVFALVVLFSGRQKERKIQEKQNEITHYNRKK